MGLTSARNKYSQEYFMLSLDLFLGINQRSHDYALCTSITCGKFPFAWSRSKNLVIYLYCDVFKAGKLTFKFTSGSSLLLEASSASSYLRFTIRCIPPPLYLHISLVLTSSWKRMESDCKSLIDLVARTNAGRSRSTVNKIDASLLLDVRQLIERWSVIGIKFETWFGY